jgi:hypothetical protein
LSNEFDSDDYEMLGSKPKKVLRALYEIDEGDFAGGDRIHKKTSLIPEQINEAVKILESMRLIDNPKGPEKLSPYDFYAIQINDLGRHVFKKFG